MSDILSSIDLDPMGNRAQATLIWLHGLGASGRDFVSLAEQFDPILRFEVRFVFPNAPLRSVTVYPGRKVPAWYDILEKDLCSREDAEGIQNAEQQIRSLIEREQMLGIKSEKIILAGFSQGGAMALYTGLRFNRPLAGIISLSAYLPIAKTFLQTLDPANQSTPIFIGHGSYDRAVPLLLGQQIKKSLEDLNYQVTWQSYPIDHTVTSEEIEAMNQFLLRVLQ